MFLGCKKGAITAMGAVIAAFVLQTAAAQNAPPPSPGAVVAPIDKPVIQPTTIPEAAVEGLEQDKVRPPSSSKKITIDRFVLSGNSLFDDSVLLGVIGKYTGTPITIEDLYQAADEVQAFYRQQGYLLASVYIPAQKVSSGTVRLEIIEGRISGIRIEGELESYRADFLINMFGDSYLGEVVSREILEERILLINDLPGLTASTVVVPGDEYGTSDLVIDVEENRSTMVIRANNYGRESLGEARIEFGWLYANLFAQADQLNLSAIAAEDSRMYFLRVDYDALLNTHGTRVGGSVSGFDYDVDTEEIDLTGDLDGDGTNVRVFVTHPLIIKQLNRLDFTAALRYNESSEEGDLAIQDDTTEVELLDLSIHWQPVHGNGSFSSVTATLTTNGEDNPDGLEDDAVKAKFFLDYSYILPFARTWFWQLRGRLGYSDDPLPDIERFRLGGPGNVRAYPATEIAGDRGYLANVDLGKRFSLSGTISMIAKLFADYGEVERIIPFAGEDKDEELSGYGAGLLFDFGGKHSLELEVATPTSDLDSSDDRDTRGWINYMVQF
jgi:hemolysin activation/secretion protein